MHISVYRLALLPLTNAACFQTRSPLRRGSVQANIRGRAPTLPSVPQKLLAKASTPRELHFSSVSAAAVVPAGRWRCQIKALQ